MGRHVVGIRVGQGANEREVLAALSQEWQMLADLDSGRMRSNRPKFPANLSWGVRFEIETLQLREPARKKDENDCARLGRCSLRLQGCHVLHAQAENADSTRL